MDNQPIRISDLPEEERNKILSMIENGECSLCGCKGLHACTGKPIVWTEEDKQRLNDALKIIFEREKNE